jgi:hypothetical protein
MSAAPTPALLPQSDAAVNRADGHRDGADDRHVFVRYRSGDREAGSGRFYIHFLFYWYSGVTLYLCV